MANDTKINVDLDPSHVLNSMKDMSTGAKKLSADIEDSLGKNAPKSVNTFKEAAENGANKIMSTMRNLGTRVKEDLKTAFDLGSVTAGLNALKEIGHGVKQVFLLEKAFDNLNIRLGFSAKKLTEFKKAIGEKVAATGQNIEDVFPAVQNIAAQTKIKSPEELAKVGELFAKVKATTGEETGGLSKEVLNLLRNQGKETNFENIQKTLDTLQATKVIGGFGTAGEAGAAMNALAKIISPEQQKKMGITEKGTGGLVSMANKTGEGGQEVLQQIMHTATQAGGKDLLNSLFGTQLFKGEKFQAQNLSKINAKNLGQYSEQTLSTATGMGQADLARFIQGMKDNSVDLSKVANSANDVAKQFEMSSDNLATKVNVFKKTMEEVGVQIGDSISKVGNDVLKGDFSKAWEHTKDVGSTLLENKGAVAGAVGISAVTALLMGGGTRGLLGKLGGGAMGAVKETQGLTKDLAIAQGLKAMGVTPVMVVNAQEIGIAAGEASGGGVPGVGDAAGILTKFAAGSALVSGAAGILTKFVAGGALVSGLSLAVAGAAGVGLGVAAQEVMPSGMKDIIGKPGEWLGGYFNDEGDQAIANAPAPGTRKQKEAAQSKMNETFDMDMLAGKIGDKVHDATVKAHQNINKNKPVELINKSAVVQGRGGGNRTGH